MPKQIRRMAKRHIILEGPDGSGKSTILHTIADWERQLTIHPKFATSKGPDHHLFDVRTQADLETLADATKTPGIYDRYPIISELIYGPIIRKRLPGWFNDSEWISIAERVLQARTIVVWCLPPFDVVRKNVSDDRDMPGVTDNLNEIYLQYQNRAEQWQGPKFIYDYTKGNMHTASLGVYLHYNLNK